MSIDFDNGKVERRFTKEWFESGIIKKTEVPRLVNALVTQQQQMVSYIEELHDKIDWILKKNKCCDIPTCLTAGCTSDHK